MKILKFLSTAVPAVNRNCSSPFHIKQEDIREILWNAIEFKTLFSSKTYNYRTNILKNKKLLYISVGNKMEITIPLLRAAKILNLDFKIIADDKWSKAKCLQDVSHYLSHYSDIIFYSSVSHLKLKPFRDGALVPIVCVEDVQYSLVDTLADIMTMYEKFGYLKGLRVGWLGLPSRELNTLLLLAPKLDVHVSFCCACDPETLVSPSAFYESQQYAVNEKPEECLTFEETIKNSNVIVTRHIDKSKRVLKNETFKIANKDWIYLRKLPRAKEDNDEEVFMDKNRCITWESYKNNVWVYASLMVKFLTKYINITPIPNFGQ